MDKFTTHKNYECNEFMSRRFLSSLSLRVALSIDGARAGLFKKKVRPGITTNARILELFSCSTALKEANFLKLRRWAINLC